jgi:ribonucleoside-diphosphate reductase beta chain
VAQERSGFASIRQGGLAMASLPMRLFAKGNRMFWNPADIDFSRDARDWAEMPEVEREAARLLAALFLAGEEAVTQDIQPFMAAVAAEGRLEDELYLTQFAFEEAKHVEGFRRWFDAVGEIDDLHPSVEFNDGYRKIFYEELPRSLNALADDPSPAAQVRAAVVYNQVVEGVLAMTGYHAWRKTARERDMLYGMQELIGFISRDERRHMAWGTYTCRRHIAAEPALWEVVTKTVEELMGPAMTLIEQNYAFFDDKGGFPFELSQQETMDFALRQFSRRLEVIEAAKGSSIEQVESEDLDVEEELEQEATADLGVS